MPLFRIEAGAFVSVPQITFKTEKALQALTEKSLLAAFNARFVASEFRTGALHAGRIDTLALSEENNPIIKRRSFTCAGVIRALPRRRA